MDFDKIIEIIKKIGKVVKALTDLAFEIGTLLAVIKLVIESLK